MENWQWAVVLRPVALFVLAFVLLYPLRRAVMRWMPEGWLKRLFLFRVN